MTAVTNIQIQLTQSPNTQIQKGTHDSETGAFIILVQCRCSVNLCIYKKLFVSISELYYFKTQVSFLPQNKIKVDLQIILHNA